MSFENPNTLYEYVKEKHQERIAEGENYQRFRHVRDKQRKNRKGLARLLSGLLSVN